MKKIHTTTSLCDHCYSHVKGIIYEKDNNILLTKKCPLHGIMTSIVEIDTQFYYGLEYYKNEKIPTVMFEATDKCQLECPHCYHLPSNKGYDLGIETILNRIKTYPGQYKLCMAGAEPTLRKDFFELTEEISTKIDSVQELMILTNGVKFSNPTFACRAKSAGLEQLNIGLNHPSYQGEAVHKLQLQGIENALNFGYSIGYIGYTIETLDHLPYILNEIKNIHHPKFINHYRIRCGSFIGRSSDSQRSYLSSTFKRVVELLGDQVKVIEHTDNNIYHINVDWQGIRLRLIQWPDVTNIDMEELNTGPWSDFYNGEITNFVHQIIVRDAYKNKNMIRMDTVPLRYQYQGIREPYWKDNWTGPKEIENLSWNWRKPK